MSFWSWFQRPKLASLPLYGRELLLLRHRQAWPGAQMSVTLLDDHFRAVTLAEVKRADKVGYFPWEPEAWDCDELAAELVRNIKVARRGRNEPSAPACGTIGATSQNGVRHAWVWFIDERGAMRFFDATERREVTASHLKNPHRIWSQ
jgi:hypothetical protein